VQVSRLTNNKWFSHASIVFIGRENFPDSNSIHICRRDGKAMKQIRIGESGIKLGGDGLSKVTYGNMRDKGEIGDILFLETIQSLLSSVF
jgi:hypothetical protein